MIRAIFARLAGKQPPPVTDNQPGGKKVPEKSREAVFTKRGMLLHNRRPEGVAAYVRTQTILDRGRQ